MSEPNDHEWILLRERGEDVSHIPASTRARYDELAGLFAALPGEAPSLGWKQRILAALDELSGPDTSATGPDEPPARDGPATDDGPPVRDISTARRHRTRRRLWVIAGGLAAAVAIGVVVAPCHDDTDEQRPSVQVVAEVPEVPEVPRVPEVPHGHIRIAGYVAGDPAVTTEIRRGDRPHRSGSGSVSIGDTLVVHVNIAPPFELRVYGDAGEPLARCTEAQGCSVEHDGKARRFRLEHVLRASGDVHVVLFTGGPSAVAFQRLNADVEAAQKAGVEARQIQVIHVQ